MLLAGLKSSPEGCENIQRGLTTTQPTQEVHAMAISRISPQDIEKQIIGDVSDGAHKEFERILVHWSGNVEWVIDRYYQDVREICRVRRKLKNPVHKKTGEPLKESTIKSYQSMLLCAERESRELKDTIRLLIINRYIGHKTRARWVREFKSKKVRSINYTRGLTEQERLFVEAYRGNAIMAARIAGFGGNFPSIKMIAMEGIKKPRIQKALRLKATHKAKKAGFSLIEGGGQGDGKRFKCGYRKTTPGKPIHLVSYCSDIKKRLCERRDRVFEVNKKMWSGLNQCKKDQNNYGLGKIKKAMKDFDFDDPKADHAGVSGLIDDVERKLGLLRGNYRGY